MSTIAQQLQELATIKEAIRQAIIAKGVTVSSDAAFSTYATAIRQISGGGGGYSVDDIKALIDRSITSFTFPSGLTSIGAGMFWGCTHLASITIPSTVTSIGQSAFCACSAITSITIPEGITALGGNSVLQQCFALTEVDLPSTLISIGQSCFSQDRNINIIICRASTPPTVSNQTFGTSVNSWVGALVTGTKTLYVPHGCSSAYTSATNEWKTVLLEPTKCNFTIAELDENGNIPES